MKRKNQAIANILMAMATNTPVIVDSYVRVIKRDEKYAPNKPNGGRPMFKQNRRAQMRASK